jgi:hypothetical protein
MSTQVYLNNLTPYNFSVGTTVNPPISEGDWEIMNGKASAGENTFLYWTNRDTGITSGVTFNFTSVLAQVPSNDQVVDLQVYLAGTSDWSDLSGGFGAEAGSASALNAAYKDTDYNSVYNVTWPQDQGWFTLSMQFVDTGGTGGDNVQYTLGYNAG